MIDNDDVKRLRAVLGEALAKRLTARIGAGQITEAEAMSDPFRAFGINQAAAVRAVTAYAEFVTEPREDDAVGFAVPWAWGEAAAMRRALIAFSDPRAKGREAAVIAALADGLDVEDALRGVSEAPTSPKPESNIVPLHRERDNG